MSTPPLTVPRAASSRLALRRAISDRVVVGPAWLLVLAATALLTSSVLYADAARRAGVREAVAAVPAETRAVAIRAPVRLDTAARDITAVDEILASALAGTGAEVVTVARSDSWQRAWGGAADELVVFESLDALEGHATIVSGRWPNPGATPREVILTEPAAAALAVDAGQGLEIRRRTDQLGMDLLVTGVVRLDDPRAERWLGQELLREGRDVGGSFTTLGPLLTRREDLFAGTSSRSLVVTWTAVVPPSGIDGAEVGSLAARVDGVGGAVDQALGTDAQVETALPAELRRIETALLAGGSGIVLLTAQLAILAAYGVVLMAGILLDQRRSETALLRSRGADGLDLARFTVLEGVGLAGSATVLGLGLAWAAVAAAPVLGLPGGNATVPGLDASAILVAAVAGGAALVGFLLPTLTSLGPLAMARRAVGRQGPRGLAQRAGLDIGLLALAALGLWQLRTYGVPITRDLRGSLGVDPLLAAAPALAILAGAILALRIVPLLAAVGERVVGRGSGLLVPLSARRLARRPGGYARTTLLLVMAAAVGVFGGAYATTWVSSQADQVDQAVGADLRVDVGDARAPAWAVGAAIAAVPGTGLATPVREEDFDLGTAGRGTLVAVLPEASGAVRLRDDRVADPGGAFAALAGLAAGRPGMWGLALPPGTAAMRITLDLALEPFVTDAFPVPLDPEYPGASVAVVVRDANGLVARFTSGRAALRDGSQVHVVALTAALGPDATGDAAGDATGDALAIAGPLELLAIEPVLQLADGSAAFGVIGLGAVAVGGSPGTGSWTALDGIAPGAWTATRQALEADPVVQATDAQGRIVLERLSGVAGPDPVRFAVRAPGLGATTPLPVPARVNAAVAEALGAATGDVVTLSEQFGDPRRLLVMGAIDGMPGVPHERALAVLDLSTLELSDYLAHGEVSRADAWWVALEDGWTPGGNGIPGSGDGIPGGGRDTDGRAASDAVATALEALPIRASVTQRAVLLAERIADPVTGSVVATLALGAIAALLFAAIGFLVAAVVGGRDRRPELAVLLALGVRARALGAAFAAEQALLLGTGLALGAGLGAVIAWVVLPSVTLGPTPGPVDPPARIVVPWEPLAGLVLVATVLLLAVSVLHARQIGHTAVARELREADA